MKRLAPVPVRPAKLILTAAALLAAIGGASAAAAPVHAGQLAAAHHAPASAGAAPRFTWHAVTLLNGWKSASTRSLPTGKPAWAVRRGVVYLRGAVRQPNPDGNETFAKLPKAAWPASNLYIQVFTSAKAPGILYVGSDGTLEAYGGNAYALTSLAAVSYPAAAVKSHQVTLENGWASSQPAYGTGDPAYAVSNGVVYLSGSLNGGTTHHLAFVLPKAARPAHLMYISVYTLDGSTGWIDVYRSGQVDIYGTDAAGYTSAQNLGLAGSNPSVNARTFTSLAAISYPLSS